MRANLSFLKVLYFVAVAGAPECACASILAIDEASHAAYTDGWQAGDNGGTGFGPWTLAYSGVLTGLFHSPHFVDLGPLSGNSLGAPAFGLTTSDRDLFSDTSEAWRELDMPIGVGHTLSVDLDGSELESSGLLFADGNTFQLFGNDGQERFGLFTNNQFNSNNWTATGSVDTGVPAGSAFRVQFKLVTANTYDLALVPIDGGDPFFTQTGTALTGTPDAAITQLRISAYGTGSSADGSRELFFDNLMVSSAEALRGDFNQDGAVEAADYVVWRKTLGQQGSGLAADGNNNGAIDPGDYDIWRAHFGTDGSTSSGAATIDHAAVPEASAMLLCLNAAIIISLFTKCRTAVR